MERTPVTSSHIHAIGYDQESRILEIEFNDGSVYQYYEVPQYEYDAVMNADSHGKYFNANIKKQYSSSKL